VAPGHLTLATLVVTGPRSGVSSSGGGAGGGHHHHFGPTGSDAGHGRRETYFVRYGLNRRTDVGLGYWARQGKARPAVNWQTARENGARPGVLVGYGSEPMGEWRHDGVYVSFLKGFGQPGRRLQAFAAYFHEIDDGTHHLVSGLSQSFGPHWSLFVGHYPFNAWHSAITYQLPSGAQIGIWAHDFSRKPRLGISLGMGWQVHDRGRAVTPPARALPDEVKQPQAEETAAIPGTTPPTAESAAASSSD
jgi:hypothetical protein